MERFYACGTPLKSVQNHPLEKWPKSAKSSEIIVFSSFRQRYIYIYYIPTGANAKSAQNSHFAHFSCARVVFPLLDQVPFLASQIKRTSEPPPRMSTKVWVLRTNCGFNRQDSVNYDFFYTMQTGRRVSTTTNVIAPPNNIYFRSNQQRTSSCLPNIIFRGNQQRTSSSPPPPTPIPRPSFLAINNEHHHVSPTSFFVAINNERHHPPPPHPPTAHPKNIIFLSHQQQTSSQKPCFALKKRRQQKQVET